MSDVPRRPKSGPRRWVSSSALRRASTRIECERAVLLERDPDVRQLPNWPAPLTDSPSILRIPLRSEFDPESRQHAALFVARRSP